MEGAFDAVNNRLLRMDCIKESDCEKSAFDLSKSIPVTHNFTPLGHNELYHGFCYNEKASFIVSEVDEKSSLRLEDVMTEITILKNLQHTSIPSFKGVWLKQISPTSYRVFTAINQCKLGTLRSLQTEYDLTWAHQIQITEDISGALAYLHNQEILHRSMLSTNVIVSDKWTAFLTGFSRACHVDYEGRNDHRNVDPENPVNDLPSTEDYGKHTDVFGIGVILMEMMLDGDELPENTPVVLQHIANQCTRMEAEERISAAVLHERMKGLHSAQDGKDTSKANGIGSPRPLSTSSLPSLNSDLDVALMAEDVKLEDTETDKSVSGVGVKKSNASPDVESKPSSKESGMVQEHEQEEDQLANFDFDGSGDLKEAVNESNSLVVATGESGGDAVEENDLAIEVDERLQAVEQAIEQLGEETSLHAAVQEKLIRQVEALRIDADKNADKEETEKNDERNTQVLMQGMSNRVSTIEARLEEQAVTQTCILNRLEEMLNQAQIAPTAPVKPIAPESQQNKSEVGIKNNGTSPKKETEELDGGAKLALQSVVQPLMEDMKNLKGAMKEILDSPIMKRTGKSVETGSPDMSSNNSKNISVDNIQQIAHTLVELLSKATSVIVESQANDRIDNNMLGKRVDSNGTQMLWSEIESPTTSQAQSQAKQQQNRVFSSTAPAGSIAQTYQPFADVEEENGEEDDEFEFGEHTHVPMYMNSPGSEAQLASSYGPQMKRMSMAASMAASRRASNQTGFGLPTSPNRNQSPHKAAGSFYGTLPVSQMPQSFSKATVKTYFPQQYLTIAGKAAGPAIPNSLTRKTVLDNQKIRKDDTIAFTASAGKVPSVKPKSSDLLSPNGLTQYSGSSGNKKVPHFAQKTNNMARRRASYLEATGQQPKSRDNSYIGSRSTGKQGTFVAKSKNSSPQKSAGVSFNQTRRMSLFHYVNGADTASFLR